MIVDRLKDGSTRVRFAPPPASQTYLYMHNLINAYQFVSTQRNLSPLLLIPLFILDYLCVHPFKDGNGRTARLWTLLLLYHAGYHVGKYISLERIIEQSKETYYESLERSSKGWHEEQHDAGSWLHYFYGTLIAAYKEFESRAVFITRIVPKQTKPRRSSTGPCCRFPSRILSKRAPASAGYDRLVLRELRDAGFCVIGMGREAKWVKIG